MNLDKKCGYDHSKLFTTIFSVLLHHFVSVMQQFHHKIS